MIEFNGAISEKNQLDRMKKVDRKVKFTILLFLAIIWIIGVVVLLPLNAFSDILPELIVCTVVMLIEVALIAKTPEKVVLRIKLSPHIVITENELALEIWKNGEKVWRKKKISQVKKILDSGEVYYIFFRFGDITNAWICQKDNIVNGTIAEFDALFQSKIIKDNVRNS